MVKPLRDNEVAHLIEKSLSPEARDFMQAARRATGILAQAEERVNAEQLRIKTMFTDARDRVRHETEKSIQAMFNRALARVPFKPTAGLLLLEHHP